MSLREREGPSREPQTRDAASGRRAAMAASPVRRSSGTSSSSSEPLRHCKYSRRCSSRRATRLCPVFSLSTFAVAFIARPIGGVVFGHFGDRFSRKSTLVVTLLMMGGGRLLAIGLYSPTYDTASARWPGAPGRVAADPGVLARRRELQRCRPDGVEHSAPTAGGCSGSLVNAGAPAGLVLANLAYLSLSDCPTRPSRAGAGGCRSG
ncbi:MHS family MFS transporter [Pseudonocardia sp. MCCB 268]|nr:MHS family MFS transporter [Pseudonocardia cytotoxica]